MAYRNAKKFHAKELAEKYIGIVEDRVISALMNFMVVE